MSEVLTGEGECSVLVTVITRDSSVIVQISTQRHAHTTDMSSSKDQPQEPTIEDCSDDEDVYYNNNNNNNTCNNNNNSECEDANNNTTTHHPFHKLGDRPLNIQVTAKVLFGSVSAISALNAERKKPK